ncbi:MAG TPA: class I SAM-dependent methyltransferase [Pyrinomonadaceae bacterium]|nr:class I SAM-dependent methyltransferase [Pyrinomonadaceae bacterium]
MSLLDDTRLIDEAKQLFADSRTFSWNLVSTRLTQFPYFDEVLGHPVWKGRKVLDFGGNVGTFLASAGDKLDHEDYWCIDINRAVVEHGRLTYPRAHFVHFNRYSSQYNPHGIRNLAIPDCGVKFDFILAFSVFTHVDVNEMVESVGALRRMLARDGVLAFTFFDPRYDRSWSAPSQPRGATVLRNLGPLGQTEMVKRARWFVIIDDRLYVEPGNLVCHQTRRGKAHESYTSFFTSELVKSLFPGATIHPPVCREWQHCCVLHAESYSSESSL